MLKWQTRIASGAKVLELGAGVGLLGASLAAAGAHVLLTDLPTLVDNATHPNLSRNKKKTSAESCPDWLQPDAIPIGSGWAGATALDWTVPLESQLSVKQQEGVEVIVASDCVWLKSMLDALLETVASIFASSPSSVFLMSFQRRDTADGEDSAMFTTVNGVINSIESRQWAIECLAWRPIATDSDKEVFVFQVTPGDASPSGKSTALH